MDSRYHFQNFPVGLWGGQALGGLLRASQAKAVAVYRGALRFSSHMSFHSDAMKTFFRQHNGSDQGHFRELPVPGLPGLEIAALTQNSAAENEVFYFAPGNVNRTVFAFLDVAGQTSADDGVSSAARQCFQTLASEKFTDDDVNEAEAMMELVLSLNLCIVRSARGTRTVPGFVACYNQELGTLCYVNAGHTPGLLRFDGTMTELQTTGMPLGLLAASTYEAPIAALPPGSSLLLVSQAVVEAAAPSNQPPMSTVKRQFEAAGAKSAIALAGEMLNTAASNGRQKPGNRHLSCLVLLRNPTAQT